MLIFIAICLIFGLFIWLYVYFLMKEDEVNKKFVKEKIEITEEDEKNEDNNAVTDSMYYYRVEILSSNYEDGEGSNYTISNCTLETESGNRLLPKHIMTWESSKSSEFAIIRCVLKHEDNGTVINTTEIEKTIKLYGNVSMEELDLQIYTIIPDSTHSDDDKIIIGLETKKGSE